MTKKVHFGLIAIVIALLIFSACFSGCTSSAPAPQQVITTQVTPGTAATTAAPTANPVVFSGPREKLLIATTTSLYDTGLLNYLETKYEAQNNVDLLITSQGTGKAIELAKKGDADVLLVHSPSQELAFLEGGNGLNRRSFASNYFLIIGPASDPAGIKGMTPENAFKTILTKGKGGDTKVIFVSRGDGSGTHSAEQNIWKGAGYTYATDVQKSGTWYVEAGKGMGDTLQMASEKGAYTLTDEGTYLAYKNNLNLDPIVTQGASLLNIYSAMAVLTSKQPVEKITMANDFINFLISPQTQEDIADYGKDKYGKSLFTPMSVNVPTAPAGYVGDYSTPATAVKLLKAYHAGSLASSFAKLEKSFEKAHPETDVQLYSGGSAAIIDKVNKQNMFSDVLASADTILIPKNLYPKNATFDVNFAKNSMVLVYTNTSKSAATINADNWYTVLASKDISYAISDPTSDPAGYRSLMTIALAERKYGDSSIFNTLVAPYSKMTKMTDGAKQTINATNPSPDGKKLVITKTGPDIIPLLKAGTVDYAFEYSSIAIQSGLPYVTLPPEIDLSDPTMTARYANVQVIRPSGSTTVTEVATPIIYGVTIPTSTRNADGGADFINLLIDKEGQAVLTADGQTPIVPAVASGTNIPAALQPNVKII
ncbi:MAG TPA: tungstate ABC transporter substrate-binding protein WtpA [Methanoregula sp.]|nr:tungstate ABC transporter substrate-binding protein WtpA [Methanoregula sp.]